MSFSHENLIELRVCPGPKVPGFSYINRSSRDHRKLVQSPVQSAARIAHGVFDVEWAVPQ